jgi:hypothetical protein
VILFRDCNVINAISAAEVIGPLASNEVQWVSELVNLKGVEELIARLKVLFRIEHKLLRNTRKCWVRMITLGRYSNGVLPVYKWDASRCANLLTCQSHRKRHEGLINASCWTVHPCRCISTAVNLLPVYNKMTGPACATIYWCAWRHITPFCFPAGSKVVEWGGDLIMAV